MADISSTLEESIINISKVLEESSKEQEQMLSYLKKIAAGLNTNIKSETLEKEINNYKNTVIKKKIILGDETEKQNKINEELINNQEEYLISENKRRISLSKLGDQLSDTYKTVSEFQGSFVGLGNILSKLPIVGSIVAPILGFFNIIDDQLDMFQTVGKSGLQFSDGLLGVNVAVSKIGVGFEKGVEILSQYNNIVQRVGIEAFSNFFENVRQSSNNLIRLGFSNDDLVKYAAEYLETQKNLSGLRAFNEIQQTKNFNNTMLELYRASQITGKAVEEIISQLKNLSEDAKSRQALQILSQESQKSIAALSAMSPDISGRLQQALLRGGIERIDDYGLLVASDLASAYQELYYALKKGVSPENLANLFAPLGKEADERAKLFLGQIRDKEASLNAEIGALANSLVINTQAAADSAEGISKDLLEVEQNFRNLMNVLQEGISRIIGTFLDPNSPIGSFLSTGLTKLNDLLASNNTAEIILNFLGSVKNLDDTFSSIPSSILSWMLSSPLNAVLAGLGLVFAKIAGSALLKNIFVTGASSLSSSLYKRLGGKGILATGMLAAGAGYYAYQSFTDGSEDLSRNRENLIGSTDLGVSGTQPSSMLNMPTLSPIGSSFNNSGLRESSNIPSYLSNITVPSTNISNVTSSRNEEIKKENEILKSWATLFEEQNNIGNIRIMQEGKQLETQQTLIKTLNSLD